MKKIILIFLLFLSMSCAPKNTAYWCGDHQCLTKKEKEDYFKKTMIVEVKSNQIKSEEKPSEVEIITNQVNIGKEQKVNIKNILSEEVQLDEKIKAKQQKKLLKETKKFERSKIKEQRKLERIINKSDREKLKDQRKLEKKAEKKLRADEKKLKKTKVAINDEEKLYKINAKLNESSVFSYFVKNILNKNKQKDFPDINNIPD